MEFDSDNLPSIIYTSDDSADNIQSDDSGDLGQSDDSANVNQLDDSGDVINSDDSGDVIQSDDSGEVGPADSIYLHSVDPAYIAQNIHLLVDISILEINFNLLLVILALEN